MLNKDADGAYVSITTNEQVEFCTYVLVNGIRFNKESDYAANTRLGLTDPKTGHKYGCICFMCNHQEFMPDKNLEYIYGLIWDWSKAKAAVKPNAQLIVESNFDIVVMEACARRMKIFQTCEAALLELTGRQGLPSALVRYLEARADTACGTCWTSSSMPQHPECQKKIDKFFKTEDELFRFASQCDPAKT